ncbi:ATP-binding protein [Streptomyces sp. NPDC002851]
MTTYASGHPGGSRPAPTSADADALLARLTQLRESVALLVERRSAADPTAADPLRGLYLSDTAIRHLLDTGAPGRAAATEGAGMEAVADEGVDRLGQLARRLGLTALDVHLLLVALAPDLDRSFEPLYGYLNDDVSRRRASIGLALDLCGLPAHGPRGRAAFHPAAPLSAFGLLRVDEPERPFLSRSLCVPDRLVGHLLGDDTPDVRVAGRLRPLTAPSAATTMVGAQVTHRLAERLTVGPLVAYLREHREGDGLSCAASALRAAGLDALHYTPGPAASGTTEPYDDVLREARLQDRALVVSPLPDDPGPLVRALAVADVPVLFTGVRPYDPRWCERDPLVLEAPRPADGAAEAWAAELGVRPDFDLAATVAPYRLSGDRLVRAARAARELAAFDATAVTAAHVRLAARQQAAAYGLEQHARRIRPDVGWADLVLPDGPLARLREVALRARHRHRVLGDWRLSAGGGRGRGVLGLFAGESGTGKTLSAEVVAAELGLDLYVVQLSSVVDKYVGETEKNLERIFTEADRTDAVLLFDEADAVFGRRSEVKDAHDRYANLESAYLLQRLESFDGIALLTTNLRANIDEAFTRRLDLVVDFPFPDAEQRLALWRHSLARVPCAEGTDPGPCAREFELAGGSIRSAVVTAAYAAAGRAAAGHNAAVTTADLLEGARREYRKAGRLVPGEGSW